MHEKGSGCYKGVKEKKKKFYLDFLAYLFYKVILKTTLKQCYALKHPTGKRQTIMRLITWEQMYFHLEVNHLAIMDLQEEDQGW